MDRLRNKFAGRNRDRRPLGFQFSLPNSLSRRHLAHDDYISLPSQTHLSNNSQANMMENNGADDAAVDDAAAAVTSDRDASTQVDWTLPTPQVTNQPMVEDEATRKRQETERELLLTASNMAAQNDQLTEKGRNLARQLNEMAREVLEANRVIEHKNGKITVLEKQLNGLQARFDQAHFDLQQAQDATGRYREQAKFQRHMHKSRIVYERQIHDMKRWVTEQDVKAWGPARVDMFLTCLQAVYRALGKDKNHSKPTAEALTTMIHLFQHVEHDPKHNGLIALADGKDCVFDYDNNPTLGRRYELEDYTPPSDKMQEAAYQWSSMAALPSLSEEDEEEEDDDDDDDDDNKQDVGSSSSSKNSVGACGCFACHVGKWASNKHNGMEHEAADTLRAAFLQTIHGMESGIDGFVSATMSLHPDFRKTALEAMRIVYQSIGRVQLPPPDVAVIRQAVIRLSTSVRSGSYPAVAPNCGCHRDGQDVDEVSSNE